MMKENYMLRVFKTLLCEISKLKLSVSWYQKQKKTWLWIFSFEKFEFYIAFQQRNKKSYSIKKKKIIIIKNYKKDIYK